MPIPDRPLTRALVQLRRMQYRRYDRCHMAVRSLYALRRQIDQHPLKDYIWRVYSWLLCPLTMWAVDYLGMANHIIGELRARREFDADFQLLLNLVADLPKDEIRLQMQALEVDVAKGKYDGLAKQPKRFGEIDDAIQPDPELRKRWTQLKTRYAGHYTPNDLGVVRRTFARERGFESRHEFNWSRKRDRFQISFDALCYRWFLYGFENDTPLTLKLTANPTPHGTMIFIPRSMSMDGKRIIVWGAVSEMHKAHGARRQGDKLIRNRAAARQEELEAKKYDKEARGMGLKGIPRYRYSLEKMGVKKDQVLHRIPWFKRRLYAK